MLAFQESQTVWEFLRSGGPIMVPLAICSIVMIAYAFERWSRLRQGRVYPALVDEAVAHVEEGRVDEAKKLVEANKAPASRILLAGLRREGRLLSDVESAFEDQAHKELERMRSGIRPLALIAGVAPLLGLLGTVLGIQEAFHRVKTTGMGKAENLAGGIEVALVTTITGLCIAIPAMLIAAWLTNRARQRLLHCDDRFSPLVEKLAHDPTEERRAA